MAMSTREIADLAREIRIQILHTIKGAGNRFLRTKVTLCHLSVTLCKLSQWQLG